MYHDELFVASVGPTMPAHIPRLCPKHLETTSEHSGEERKKQKQRPRSGAFFVLFFLC